MGRNVPASFVLGVAVTACKPDAVAADDDTGASSSSGADEGAGSSETGDPDAGMTPIPEQTWRIGDPDRGRDVLIYGDNTGGGIPYEIWVDLPGPPKDNLLEREGLSADVPWFFNAWETAEGVTVVGPGCLSCHASRFSALGDELVIGLGSAFAPSGAPTMGELALLKLQIDNVFGPDSPEAAGFQPFFDGVNALIGFSEPPFPGPNGAFFVEEAALAHRDPATLAWSAEPRFDKESEVLASDVPPWWHLRKKNALYYNGMGRGDAARLLMQSSVLATPGLAHLQGVDETMPDLVAYLLTVEAPPYPGSVDAALADTGQAVFEATCSRCHGTYDPESYPNLLVDLDTVGTDPAYAEHFMQPGRMVDAYNDGWYATGDPASSLQPEAGYVAPPLDGVWASAPYFHNGSVPTIEGVLDSSSRPAVWLRDFETRTYDIDAFGLTYEAVEAGTVDAYDTSVRGYGNEGHTFGDVLSADDRRAVIEYLKTL